MISLKKASLLVAAAALLLPAAASARATGGEYNDVVKDSRGNIVVSTDGNCVITKWTSGHDECRGVVHHGIVARLSREQRTVYFDFNKSTLNEKEKRKLNEVSKMIVDSKEVESVDIVGYADQIGKQSYNKALSKRRADTVKAYLASKGLKTHRVRVEGLGEENSVTHCDPKMARKDLIACLAPDRRVEMELNLKK